MEQPDPDTLKHREVAFRDLLPGQQQALDAILALSDIDGVLDVSLAESSRNSIHVSYDLRQIDLSTIEALLFELGFHLDNSLFAKIKRALYYYTESNELENLSTSRDQDHSTRDIFTNCYLSQRHGCRDTRPEHWRRYL